MKKLRSHICVGAEEFLRLRQLSAWKFRYERNALLVMMLKIDSFKNFFWLLVTLMPKAKEWPSVQKKRTVTARKGNYWERWWWENTVLSNSKESSQYRVLSYLMDFFYKALSSILHALDKNREIHFLKKIHESKKWP